MIAHVISLLAAEDPTQTHSWILPETAEIIYGGLATVIVVGALAKFAGPMIKKSFSARTEKIQKELDDAAAAKVTAESDAQNIRKALGDVAGERARILAEADAQASAVLAEGRTRITAEIAELEAKAEAEIAAARGRGSDELRNEISVLASRATPIVVAATLNDQIHKDLVENFISKVGAGR
ncbi:MAG: synthase subunit [Actinomycetota bacterium]|jgi:F-type H+-transporting ATPase subunit b